MQNYQISDLIDFISRMPSVGPRSAKKIAISMIKDRKNMMNGFANLLINLSSSIKECTQCRNFDITEICHICTNRKNANQLCIVADIDDLWNVEKSDAFSGIYYVLGGYLSATTSTLPQNLELNRLCNIIQEKSIQEVIFALGSTISAQTTYYYVYEEVEKFIKSNNISVKLTSLAFGIPMGSEIDYLDEGTILQSFRSRG